MDRKEFEGRLRYLMRQCGIDYPWYIKEIEEAKQSVLAAWDERDAWEEDLERAIIEQALRPDGAYWRCPFCGISASHWSVHAGFPHGVNCIAVRVREKREAALADRVRERREKK